MGGARQQIRCGPFADGLRVRHSCSRFAAEQTLDPKVSGCIMYIGARQIPLVVHDGEDPKLGPSRRVQRVFQQLAV